MNSTNKTRKITHRGFALRGFVTDQNFTIGLGISHLHPLSHLDDANNKVLLRSITIKEEKRWSLGYSPRKFVTAGLSSTEFRMGCFVHWKAIKVPKRYLVFESRAGSIDCTYRWYTRITGDYSLELGVGVITLVKLQDEIKTTIWNNTVKTLVTCHTKQEFQLLCLSLDENVYHNGTPELEKKRPKIDEHKKKTCKLDLTCPEKIINFTITDFTKKVRPKLWKVSILGPNNRSRPKYVYSESQLYGGIRRSVWVRPGYPECRTGLADRNYPFGPVTRGSG